jgi:antitoxin VapB
MSSSAAVRHVRLFKNGTSQAVRIPREFELPGNEAVLSRDEHGRLIIESIPHRNLLGVIASWKPLPENDQFPGIDDLPTDPVEI